MVHQSSVNKFFKQDSKLSKDTRILLNRAKTQYPFLKALSDRLKVIEEFDAKVLKDSGLNL